MGVVVVFLSSCTLTLFPPTKSYILYPVREGDSLRSIASRFGVSIDDMQISNSITGTPRLVVGTILKVPYKGQKLSRREGDLPNPKTSKEIAVDKGSQQTVVASVAKRFIGQLLWPVTSAPVMSPFGSRWGTFHEGIDLGGSEGTPIYASHAGQVVYSDDGLRGYGNLIVIKTEGLMTVYAHNRRNGVKVGDWVKKGEQIGTVGQTGKATGPHLHYEARVKNKKGKYVAVDPLVFFKAKK
jgi:murein DD-endopeptidase MepM/ murein hydrolase activator NlpD